MNKNTVLVIRGYGGFGDLCMISRPLRKLQQGGCDVGLVIDKKWHSLFEDWYDLKIFDKEVGVWDRVIDIRTPCPAAEVESRWVMNSKEPTHRSTVPIDRLSIFANRMGIQLSSEERVPFIALDKKRKAIVKKPAVYLQMHTAESYRDWDYMKAIAKGIVARGIQVWTQGGSIEGASEFKGSIIEAVALIKSCSMVVSPDSFAVHAAAAVGTPCVAIMGPIGAKARIGNYPLASAIMVDLPCVPCWRNESIFCHKNNSLKSWCMQHLHEGAVYQHVMNRICDAMYGNTVPSTKYIKVKNDHPRI